MWQAFALLVLACFSVFTGCATLGLDDAGKYLKEFGYLGVADRDDSSDIASSLEDIGPALRLMQRLANIPITGRLDEATKEMMSTPRCGVQDIVADESANIADPNSPSAFSLGSKWPSTKKELTWKLDERHPSSKLSSQDIRMAFADAFKMWADKTPLTFREITGTGKADLNIQFRRTRHDDNYPFDGQGRVLAHAFFPTNGQIHFDEDEQWVLRSSSGTDVFTVAAHEFGHALGLRHSSAREALMAPFYKGFDRNLVLSYDDVRGIQSLYGSNTGSRVTKKPPKTTPRPTAVTRHPPTDDEHSCDLKDGTVLAAPDGNVYLVQKRNVYKVGDSGLHRGYPLSLQSVFPGAPTDMDASVYSPGTRKTYMFQGSKVWRYNATFGLDRGYPRQLDQKFPETPQAAIAVDGYWFDVFVFGHSRFWAWNVKKQKIVQGYPLPIHKYFRGLPDIHAAIYNEKRIHFFTAEGYFRFQMDPSTSPTMDSLRSLTGARPWLKGVCKGYHNYVLQLRASGASNLRLSMSVLLGLMFSNMMLA